MVFYRSFPFLTVSLPPSLPKLFVYLTRLFKASIWALVLSLCACSSDSTPPSVDEQLEALETVDFNFHVKPILSRNCFACHGPDPSTREADLRLDVEEAAYAERDSFPAVMPGIAEESLVYLRITAGDPEEVMPPPESHKTLSELDVGILKKWIEQGAVYKKHWAFIPPVQPERPSVSRKRWPRNDIDYFVLAGMERQGLSPSPEADPFTLARRLSFDLTGLPPDPAEVDAFLSNPTEETYEALVDRLLASPRFGERMALHWMDLARYADTNGYSIDGGRHMWLWRDWVINAFNTNMPFDRFLTEQLAGDLLEAPSEEQRIATGFNRNHMITHEGGTIPAENLTNYAADRVKTTGEVFLGLTMGCAQCHDHKFDPISQKDYYRFFAFFNTIADKGLDGDRGINAQPSIMARSPMLNEAEIQALRQKIEHLSSAKDTLLAEQREWERQERSRLAELGTNFRQYPLQPLKITTPNRGNTGAILPDSSLLIDEAGWLAAYNVSARIDADRIPAPITGLRIEFYPHEVAGGFLGHSAEDSLNGAFVLTALTLSHGDLPSDQVDLFRTVPIEALTASTSAPEFPVTDVFDERNHNGWSPHPENSVRQHITATFEAPIDPAESPYMTAMLVFGKGSNLIAGHFKLFAITGHDTDTNWPVSLQAVLQLEPGRRTPAQARDLRAYFLATSQAAAPVRIQLANWEDRLTALTQPFPTMVMQDAEEPRQTFVLNRGQYDQPLEAVAPGLPALFAGNPGAETASRLDLAQWLTSRENPLTARVTVNRFWQLLFGTGIVATPADFGSQGALPSHPALLDALATGFMETGWDTRALIKQMVMSATYRQSSESTPRRLGRDPDNRYLARGPRFRLQAEFVRDAALQVSGLLSNRIGGPSVKPYQPPGLWKEVSHYGSTPATAQVFVQDHGEKLYRRSMYTYWKRTAPPPSMAAFDAPNREVCTVQREITNTPLQALVLLNDPQFVEASRHFAARILAEGPDEEAGRLELAFQRMLTRPADEAELDVLARRLADEKDYYAEHPEQAVRLLRVGESPNLPGLDPVEHAAWTVISNLLMNLSENITRS